MSKVIKIHRGLDISLKGSAEKVLAKFPLSMDYAVKPIDFQGLTPKLLVKEGDTVLAGMPLFVDKYRPEIRFASPVSGTVKEIVRGDKRKLLAVTVTPTPEQQHLQYKIKVLETLPREELIAFMLESGVWSFMKQRPYGIVAHHNDKPKAIFISCFDTAPLAPDIEYVLNGEAEAFQKGIDVLRKLCDNIHVGTIETPSATSIIPKIKGITMHAFAGPHPAGNVGIQIYHLSPINKGEIVWTITPQHVVSLGRLFLKGIYDVSKVIALAGSEVKKPRYFRIIDGANIAVIREQLYNDKPTRYISGNVLTGTNIGTDGHLGFYDNLITVIPEGDHYEFLGWANPLRLKKYSVSRSYFSWIFPKKEYALDTNINGGQRAFVMTGEYEKVLPMDIYPVYLLKAILAEDIDKMEQLGIYEVIEEDLALCEFVCTSKIDVQDILRKGIDLMIKEMGDNI
ncbi:MAG: Na(+)-translocating NADH-quinone reductase subunit A [Prevotellaceae bacterium]|jgi:Na+-transporting NADH:ubiquinone oxidoreductase subunit A|nr:Na(+)-translocating NADH-quinone reductase subunit A [Prevotellaceae bacterium]